MRETFPSGQPWSLETVHHLRSLAQEQVSAPIIAMILKRPEPEIHAKASELGIALKMS